MPTASGATAVVLRCVRWALSPSDLLAGAGRTLTGLMVRWVAGRTYPACTAAPCHRAGAGCNRSAWCWAATRRRRRRYAHMHVHTWHTCTCTRARGVASHAHTRPRRALRPQWPCKTSLALLCSWSTWPLAEAQRARRTNSWLLGTRTTARSCRSYCSHPTSLADRSCPPTRSHPSSLASRSPKTCHSTAADAT